MATYLVRLNGPTTIMVEADEWVPGDVAGAFKTGGHPVVLVATDDVVKITETEVGP